MENEGLTISLVKGFMATIIFTIEKEYHSDIIIVKLETLKNILEELGFCFLTELEVKELSEKMFDLLEYTDKQKINTCESAEDFDEEENQIIDEFIKQEEEVQIAISELVGALFKTHKTMTLGIANLLI